MRLASATFFLRRNLRRKQGRTVTAIGAIAVAVAIFHIMAALALALWIEALGKIEKLFPEHTLVVRSRAVEIGPLAISPGLLTARITTDTVQRISGLPGVASVWPQLPLLIPAMAVGKLAGYEGATDVIVFGVPAEMVGDEVVGQRGFTYADPATSTVPVLVSRYFLDLFNLGLAEGQGLPKLTDRAVVGRHFHLLLGRSLLQLDDRQERVRKAECEIVGLTQDPSLLGLVAPIEYVREFNRWYHGAKAAEKYVQAHVVLASPEHCETVAERLERWGLQVEGGRDRAQRLRLLVNGGAIILLLFGLAVLAMAGINIVNTFALIMQERRGEIGLLRAVGATRGAAMGLLLAESAAVGLAGGVIGSGFASVAARLGNEALARWLPPLLIAPDHWFYESVLLLVLCAALAVLGSTSAAAPVLWRSVRRWPADLLREY